jgi:flagellar basal body-associated protein FliL
MPPEKKQAPAERPDTKKEPDAAEKPQASLPRSHMFSPTGALVMVAVLLVEGIAVALIAGYFAKAKNAADVKPLGKVEYFDVGETKVVLPMDERSLTTRTITVGVQLELRPDDKLTETKDALTRMKPKILDKIQMLLLKETCPAIYAADTRERLKNAIKAEVAGLLGDPERVTEVVFTRYIE